MRGTRRKGANIDKHHRDFLFRSAESRIARQYFLGCLPSNVSAKCLSQLFFFAQSRHHQVELTDQRAEFVGPSQRDLHVEPALRHRLGCLAQFIDRFCNRTANQERGKQCERCADHTDKDAEQLRIGSGRRWRKKQQQQRSDRTNACRNRPHESAHPQRNRSYSFQPIRPRVLEKQRKQPPLGGPLDHEKTLRRSNKSRDPERNRQMPE